MKTNEVILEVKNISKSFISAGKQAGILDTSFSVKKGQVICLVGPSGAGKTTLLRCLAGLEKINSGQITLLDQYSVDEYSQESTEALKNNVTFVFQDLNLWPHKTVLENIIFAPVKLKKMPRTEATELADSLLTKFGLHDKRGSYPDFLSGGQKQRVAIIRALAMKPKLLLLDEITSALDPELVNSVLNVVKILAKEGQSMIIATHHLKFATEVADKIIFLEAGQIVQESTSRDFVYAQRNERIQGFIKALSLHKQEINVYEGYDEFQAYQLGTLKRFKKGSTKDVVGSSGDRWFECMGDYYKQYENERIKKGIAWRMIMYQESPLDRKVRLRHPDLNEYRLIPKHLENPANYYVIEDVVVIQIFGEVDEPPAIIEIKNANVAKSYQSYFKLLWEQSVPLAD